jgi:hypothetical protein
MFVEVGPAQKPRAAKPRREPVKLDTRDIVSGDPIKALGK